MIAPLAVYVTRTHAGALKDILISNKPPAGAEVHLRTRDPADAKTVADRLRITLAPTFDAAAFREGPRYPVPDSIRNGRPRKSAPGATLAS
ncbi:hypothetical protein Q8W71_30975 [Methylobacterium sp. NEAU 140]|uniref:hypothetical protein n=1 Tax=Methylobacterium sp. NEAU 140 TaxID=3064945 RepID=UPI002732D345|nr:hypothetical protein [Methylobacterium sp. NEAU 140]MDP4027016.1 hypothetical protein [Methylobacterium sp. NEAU 140]